MIEAKLSNSLSQKQKAPENHFEGFDFLRAIFSIAIVGLKTDLFLLLELLVSGALAYSMMAKVAYLAVPIFLQVSLFLFYFKSAERGFSYFLLMRLPKLISLYLFWVGLKVLLDIFIRDELESIRKTASSPRSLIELIVSGDQSPFFFFFALIFLTTAAAILTFLFKKLQVSQLKKLFINYALLFASCLFIVGLSGAELFVNQFGGTSLLELARSASNIAFWDYNPLSFLPYLFTAAITVQELNEGKLKSWSSSLKLKVFGLLLLSVLITVLEWHFFEKLLHYSRLSLVFSSWLLLYLALLSPLKAPSGVKFLSSCSLGIYAFHVFLTH
ncbi:MAG: acyltransferase family protein [Stenomitos frigidus ULC029]